MSDTILSVGVEVSSLVCVFRKMYQEEIYWSICVMWRMSFSSLFLFCWELLFPEKIQLSCHRWVHVSWCLEIFVIRRFSLLFVFDRRPGEGDVRHDRGQHSLWQQLLQRVHCVQSQEIIALAQQWVIATDAYRSVSSTSPNKNENWLVELWLFHWISNLLLASLEIGWNWEFAFLTKWDKEHSHKNLCKNAEFTQTVQFKNLEWEILKKVAWFKELSWLFPTFSVCIASSIQSENAKLNQLPQISWTWLTWSNRSVNKWKE